MLSPVPETDSPALGPVTGAGGGGPGAEEGLVQAGGLVPTSRPPGGSCSQQAPGQALGTQWPSHSKNEGSTCGKMVAGSSGQRLHGRSAAVAFVRLTEAGSPASWLLHV